MLQRIRVSLLILCFCSLNLYSQEQIITNELSLGELRPGQSLQLSIVYDTTDNKKTAGLGLRLHFNSSAVEFGDLTERFSEAALPFQIKDDTTNLDKNIDTDKYFLTSWADTSGQGWPYNSDLPITLYSLPITAKENFNSTTFQFTGYTAVGYSLSADNIVIPLAVKPVIILSGDAELSLELGTPYTDSGATASDNIDGDITSSIVTINNVDIYTVGTYSVTYNVSDAAGNAADEVTRTVNITPDVTKPVITITGGDIAHEQGTPYTDLGATALDNIDGDITSSISVENNVDSDTAGTYTVVYSVSDSSGNAADQKTRTVIVSDTTEPVINLIGDSEIELLINDIYVDDGATAVDNIDGDITEQIITRNPVNTSEFGTYIVTYNVMDSSGNEAVEVTRSVYVGGTLDVDGNGRYDALTDGLLILRYMFGLDGETLISGTVASDATFKTPAEIEAQIEFIYPLLDVDGNSNVDPLTDGLLIVRYLFELRGTTLILGVIATDATRRTSEEIEALLSSLTP